MGNESTVSLRTTSFHSTLANKIATYRHTFKRFIESRTGLRLFRAKSQPHGLSLWDDMRKAYRLPRVVFDVGANVGQFASSVLEAIPEATLYCFEPERSSFDELSNSLRKTSAKLYECALGQQVGEGELFVTGGTTNSFRRPASFKSKQQVEIACLDSILEKEPIDQIDLLKIDTEGYEMEVLRGARATLDNCRVGSVLVEVGFHPEDERHTCFDGVREFLMQFGFRIFGFYEQHLEWSGEPALRYSNVLMVRP